VSFFFVFFFLSEPLDLDPFNKSKKQKKKPPTSSLTSASSAAVATVSNPMNAKNTTELAAKTPLIPSGANGFRFEASARGAAARTM